MKNTCFINENSKGVFIISTTPFSKDGSIDFDSVDQQMRVTNVHKKTFRKAYL